MSELELGPKTAKLIDRMTDAIELLAAIMEDQNKRWQNAMEVEIEEDTVLECCDCERTFRAFEEDAVRTKEGDVYCVPCHRKRAFHVCKGTGT